MITTMTTTERYYTIECMCRAFPKDRWESFDGKKYSKFAEASERAYKLYINNPDLDFKLLKHEVTYTSELIKEYTN